MVASEKLKISDEVEKELLQTFSNYQKQHNDYEKHILSQISTLQNQIAKIQGNRLIKNCACAPCYC